ncbi:MAG TPA: L-ectoine synthase [Betaproteobacteria bacterium]|nr:L-ectoine synthase [Betaproteobacteria bacterium]
MIVRKMADIIGSAQEVVTDNWASRRMLLKSDGMSYSFHETIIFPGTETLIWYKNHLEAVYCVEGEGEVELIPEGAIYPIEPGTMYALDKHDKHHLRAKSRMRLICVFNPPLTGREVHDEEGVYAVED